MCFFLFAPRIHSIQSTKLKKKNLLPLELLAELVNFLSFDFKFVKLRVSIIFDLFVLKNQRHWIVRFGKIVRPFYTFLGNTKTHLETLKLQCADKGTDQLIAVREQIINFHSDLQSVSSKLAKRSQLFKNLLLAANNHFDTLEASNISNENTQVILTNVTQMIGYVGHIFDSMFHVPDQDVTYVIEYDGGASLEFLQTRVQVVPISLFLGDALYLIRFVIKLDQEFSNFTLRLIIFLHLFETMYESAFTDNEDSEFKKQFKFYKRRDRSLDLSAVLDPHKYCQGLNLNKVSDKCLIAVEKFFNGISGLRPIKQWTVTTFLHRPGLFIIGGVLTVAEQLCWIERCLLEYPEPPNITNLFVQNNDPYKGSDVFKNCSKKLRWVTMGNDYNWNTKEYSNLARQPLPNEMVKLSRLVVCSLGLDDFFPDAAIVNFYPEKSYLSPHVDRSERDLTHPLVSISLGQSAIYLTGGTSLNDPVDALLLRSGDILIMSGEQRLVYHAVPRILDGNAPFGEEYIQMVKQKEILEYANNCRINITIRQVDN